MTWCPACGRDITSNVYEAWKEEGEDSDNEFPLECPHCQYEIAVEVEYVPEFVVS